MRILWFLPSYHFHQIERQTAGELFLRSPAHNEGGGRKALVSLMGAGLLLLGVVLLRGRTAGWIAEFMALATTFLVLNAFHHLLHLRKRNVYHRFLSFSRTGIQLRRDRNDRPELIPIEHIDRLLIVREGFECRLQLNGSLHPRCYLFLSGEQQEKVMQAIVEHLALQRLPDTVSGGRTLTDLRSNKPTASQPATAATTRQIRFFQVKESEQQLTILLNAVGGGSGSRYGRFVYTYDGYFHQMNTGTRVKLPIAAAEVAQVQVSVDEVRSDRGSGNTAGYVSGELRLLLRNKEIETLLYVNHRAKRDSATALLALRAQLEELQLRLEAFCATGRTTGRPQ